MIRVRNLIKTFSAPGRAIWDKVVNNGSKAKPRVLLLVDKRGWAFDISARQIARHLGGYYDFEFKYVVESPKLSPKRYDLVYLFFWGEECYQKFGFEPSQLIKQISSHRWEDGPPYGPYSPPQMADRYLSDAGTVTCTSLRLLNLFKGLHPRVCYTPNGVNPLFRPLSQRRGPLRIGWAGNVQDSVKRFSEIVEPACRDRFSLLTAGGKVSHEKMNEFYNSIDVIAISSRHEGEPLPLMEGMATGCFPVCVDVGIVPELIRSGDNGLIVKDATADAFRDAFSWCEANLDKVREAGSNNPAVIAARQWPEVIHHFKQMLDDALTARGKA